MCPSTVSPRSRAAAIFSWTVSRSDLLVDRLLAGDDGRNVHDFTKCDDGVGVEQPIDCFGTDGRAAQL